MINLNELRIGNWVNYNSDYCTVTKIDEWVGVKFKDDNIGSIPIAALKPILITPEILLKCGFENTSKDFELLEPIFKKRFIELFIVYGDANQVTPCIAGKFIPLVIKYVNQLQNLYFSLTSEELIINL